MANVGAMENVKDSNIISVLKANWLETNPGTIDENKQKIALLTDLFTTYSKLWRIPKLVAKLLTAINDTISSNSGGIYFSQGYVDVSVLRTFSKCICSVPFGQALELWELFLQGYEKTILPPESNSLSPGGAYLVAQFFSTFLLHVQLFNDTVLPVIKEKVALLIAKMQELLQNTSIVLDKEQNVENLSKLSYLSMVHAYSEIKLVFHVYGASHLSIGADENDACCAFQLFPLHNFLGCNHTEIYLPFFEANDKRFGYIVYKLLIQGIKAKIIKQEIDNKEKKWLKTIVTLLLETTISSTMHCTGASWDFDVNSIDSKNYGVAYWNLFLGHIHLFAGFISDKNLVSLCSAILEVLINSVENRSYSDMSLESLVSQFISSSFYVESKAFQTAFVTSIWKCCSTLLCIKKRSHSELEAASDQPSVALLFQELHNSERKWEKYAQTTPKGMENHDVNAMWSMVKIAANMLNLMLESSSTLPGKLKTLEIARLLKVFNFLPLEYLMPNNQMRCILGLSTIFFLLQNSDTTSDSGIYQSQIDVLNLLVPIFEGVRSIWFFDFVHPVPYIKAIISNLEKMHESDFQGNSEICRKLLDSIFNLSTRNLQSILSIEAYIPELIADAKKCRNSALAFLCLLQRLIQLLQRSYLQPQFKEVCERLAVLACSSIAKSMHHWKRDGKNDMEIFSSLLTCYEGLIRLVLNQKCKFKEEKCKKWLKYLKNVLEMAFEKIHESVDEDEIAPFLTFICTVAEHRTDLSLYVSNDFSLQLWRFLCHFISHKVKSSTHNFFIPGANEAQQGTQTSYQPKCDFCHKTINTQTNKNCMQSGDQEKTVTYVCSSSSSSNMCNFSDFVRKYFFTDSERNTLVHVIKTSSKDELDIIFQELSNDIEQMESGVQTLNAVDFVIKLSIVSCLFNAAVNEMQVALSKLTQKCLSSLNCIVYQTCSNADCLLRIVVPSLSFMCSVLKKGKNILPKQCITQCLHTCMEVKAEACTKLPAAFVSTYTAVWSVLHELMVSHPYNMLSSIPAFMENITYLMKLIIYASNQSVMSTYNDETRQEILLCAQNLDRVLGLMTKYKKEFAKVVPQLITIYVDVVQTVTIYPSVKAVLVTGINKLLDICSEESLKMLALNINYKCREIFNSLVKNYKQQCFVGRI